MVMLTEMWKGNPVLTTVIFGLPSGFLLLICYSIHCTDILDADEDDGDDGETPTFESSSFLFTLTYSKLVFFFSDSSHEKKE